MLGPLPTIYRVLVSAAVLVVFATAGAWTAFKIPYPVLLSVGASVGLVMGTLCAYLLVHQAGSPRERHRRPQ